MSARKKRSKKRSDANSKSPPSEVPFFLDRNLGKHIIADALREADIQVELHDDHLMLDAPDEDWIALVGRKGWLAITKDKNIRYRYAEIAAIKKYNAKLLVVRAKNATGEDIADILVNARARIYRFTEKNKAPFVAGIVRSGRIESYDV